MKRYVIASTILALLAFTAGANANTTVKPTKVFYTSGYAQLRSPGNDEVLAHLSLPAGRFLLSANVMVLGSDLTGLNFAIVGCSINPIFTTSQMSITPMSTEGMVPLSAVGTLAVPSTVTLTCAALSGEHSVPDGQLLAQVRVFNFTAMLVSALIDQT